MKGGNALASVKSIADERLSVAYREYGKCLEKYCRVRLGEAADFTDDCVQEAFCIYYKKLLANEIIDKPKAFLYRTADNMIKRVKAEHYKNASRLTPLEEAENVEAQITDEMASLLDYDKLRDTLIDELKEQEKLLYIRKYIERKSLKEIAIELGIPPTTVANRTSRLRTRIKALTTQMIDELEKGGS